ncbi:MAG: hypothetical protein ACOCG5_04080 [Candidatus Alkaliphilus sp. MAG34]
MLPCPYFRLLLKHKGTADCVKNVILSEAKDPKWPKNEILRCTQKFARVTHTTINESIIVKYRSFAGQANPVRLRMTKMWAFIAMTKSEKSAFSHSLTVRDCRCSG